MTSNHAPPAVARLAPAHASLPGTTDPTRTGREAPPAQVGLLVAAIIVQLALITTVSGVVSVGGAGPGAAGWLVGIACAASIDLALARALSHFGTNRLTPADCVTFVRATLVAVVATLVADSFAHPVRIRALVAFAAVALMLDAVDGWVARRTATGRLGASFDAEVDALLILILSVYVARSAGPWLLLIGAARYGFLVAGWIFPWMRAPLPPRYWRKVVAATQGIVLTIAAANVLPAAVTRAGLVCAFGLLAESFGRDVWWLRINRRSLARRGSVDTGAPAKPGSGPRRSRMRTALAASLTVLAVLFAWAALVGPDQPIALELGAFARLPLEGSVLLALGALMPPRARALLVWVVGPLLGLVLILKLANIGFYTAFNRPFDPYEDLSYVGFASQTLRSSVGQTTGILILVALGTALVSIPILMSLAVRRVIRITSAHRVWTLRTVAGLGAGWILCWAIGAELVPQTPVASASAASLLVSQVNAVQADIHDRSTFARQIRRDQFAAVPTSRLLTGLRGKDVLLLFVESYGKVAVQGTSISPGVDAVLASGDERLRTAGFSARSAFMTSPTFGGISWLAHSTLQSGLWVNTPQRYSQLLGSDRFTLTEAFHRAGWRTVDDVPSDDRFWAPGKKFYHFDKQYNRYDVRYHGPRFAFASMPDQYVFWALRRLELAKPHRRPVFAEVDLASSHEPWTLIPRMIPWTQVGNGSIFWHETVHTGASFQPSGLSSYLQTNGSPVVRAAYGESIRYTLNTLISFVQHYGNPNLVLVVLGDHQPWTVVSGAEPSHEVPISIIAHDPSVLKQVSRWGWSDGLLPGADAPVWPMNAFRNRFLTTFGPRARTSP